MNLIVLSVALAVGFLAFPIYWEYAPQKWVAIVAMIFQEVLALLLALYIPLSAEATLAGCVAVATPHIGYALFWLLSYLVRGKQKKAVRMAIDRILDGNA